jgi:hypothetical protein
LIEQRSGCAAAEVKTASRISAGQPFRGERGQGLQAPPIAERKQAASTPGMPFHS